MQDGPNFFYQCRSNHLYGLLPRVSCRKKSLKRLPRFGRIIVTNLVLNYLQYRCFQVRIVFCPFNVWLIGSFAWPTVPLSLSSHLLCPSFFLITPDYVYHIISLPF